MKSSRLFTDSLIVHLWTFKFIVLFFFYWRHSSNTIEVTLWRLTLAHITLHITLLEHIKGMARPRETRSSLYRMRTPPMDDLKERTRVPPTVCLAKHLSTPHHRVVVCLEAQKCIQTSYYFLFFNSETKGNNGPADLNPKKYFNWWKFCTTIPNIEFIETVQNTNPHPETWVLLYCNIQSQRTETQEIHGIKWVSNIAA